MGREVTAQVRVAGRGEAAEVAEGRGAVGVINRGTSRGSRGAAASAAPLRVKQRSGRGVEAAQGSTALPPAAKVGASETLKRAAWVVEQAMLTASPWDGGKGKESTRGRLRAG